MADADKPMRRRAFVWTRDEIVTVDVDGEWPDLLRIGAECYRPNLTRDGKPMASRGRHVNIEYVHYNCRVLAVDVPEQERAAIVAVEEDAPDGNGERARVAGSPEGDGVADEQHDDAPRRRRHFNGGERSDAV